MIGAVSPHLDDVVLSCASFVGAHPGSLMVTVFADGPAAVDPLPFWDAECGSFMPGDDITGARWREDRRAADILGASCCHLGFWDFQYRRTKYGYRGPKLADSLAEDIAADLAPLVERADLDQWLIPLGILHPDHQLTARACLEVAAHLPELDWILYEELPYAVAYPEERDRAMTVLSERGFELVTVEGTEDADAALKRRAIDCYRSQLGPLGEGIETAVATSERLFRLVPVSTP
jgi:LmbE family N-acetylglucosaminyl deacetylase